MRTLRSGLLLVSAAGLTGCILEPTTGRPPEYGRLAPPVEYDRRPPLVEYDRRPPPVEYDRGPRPRDDYGARPPFDHDRDHGFRPHDERERDGRPPEDHDRR